MTGILLILTLQASDARDTSYVEVTAEGVAALGASADIARDNAIKDALRKAVEQGVGAYIDSKTAVDNYELLYDKIYSHAQGYVASYEVVKEKADKDAGLYRVWIKAKVKAGIIQNDLVAMGILVSEMGRPRLAVVVDNEDLAYTLEDYFQEQGFPLVDLPTVKKVLKADELDLLIDGDKRTAQKVATLTGAEILITGRAEVSSEMKKLPYTDE
ncbi:MAG: flagellar assembly protein T N-terminal domain-containing protein, partial [candidate division WOR-3 bacterium]